MNLYNFLSDFFTKHELVIRSQRFISAIFTIYFDKGTLHNPQFTSLTNTKKKKNYEQTLWPARSKRKSFTMSSLLFAHWSAASRVAPGNWSRFPYRLVLPYFALQFYCESHYIYWILSNSMVDARRQWDERKMYRHVKLILFKDLALLYSNFKLYFVWRTNLSASIFKELKLIYCCGSRRWQRCCR